MLKMPLIHIVMFKFKPGTSATAAEDACQALLALKDSCVHPESKKPYIKSVTGGKDNSPEGLQKGIEYAFVVEFESTADRDYYVASDPAHQAFVQMISTKIEIAQAVDYSPGQF
ncbi:stress responsive A/B barrel domain-containing protein [Favolaschia claudopus]|uniref:Stress responsive A/B barrel domain-containing protein n=1 Tax=Favolaschia claudopus TaxID=2862362 RepID=A0AAW0DYZ3_9AGAR